MAQNRNYSSTALPTTFFAGCTSSATTIQVVSTTGLPTSYPFTMDAEWGTANAEVITITQAPTGSAGDYTFANCLRGQDGTTGVAHLAGASICHGLSAQDLAEPQTHMQATGYTTAPAGGAVNVHGIGAGANTGSVVVGTLETQALQNKNLTASTNTFPTFNQNTTGNAATATTATSATTATTAGNVTGLVARDNGGSGGSCAYNTATQAITATAAPGTAITSLSVALTAGTTYLIELSLDVDTTSTAGATDAAFAFTGTLTAAYLNWQWMTETTATTASNEGGTITGTTITGTMASGAHGLSGGFQRLWVRGVLVVNAAGTLSLGAWEGTSGDTFTVYSGSVLRASRIA
jgi:hypothetical protein